MGGVGEKYTLPLVARYADVWNVPTYALGELEHKLSVLRSICEDDRPGSSTIVLSVEAVMALAPDERSLPAVRQLAEKRFGVPAFGLQRGRPDRHRTGDGRPLHELQDSASVRSCCSPTTAARIETLELLAYEVIAQL